MMRRALSNRWTMHSERSWLGSSCSAARPGPGCMWWCAWHAFCASWRAVLPPIGKFHGGWESESESLTQQWNQINTTHFNPN